MSYDLVDWAQAPRLGRWWAVDANGKAHWYCEPDIVALTDFWFAHSERAPDFDYQGNYRDSLTARPTKTQKK